MPTRRRHPPARRARRRATRWTWRSGAPATFANRQIAMVSTPTIAEVSRIEQAYLESDQRKYYVPCPHCGAFQVLRWAQVKWPDRKPAEAWYECERCHGHIADHHKAAMLERGEWRAEAAGDGETAGFWLNGLYSPWTTWGQLAKDFLRARKSPERMQTFTNTVLAETFQQAGATKTDASELLGRRQPYRADIMLPAGVVLITLGADLQADRIEVEIVGWGRDEESWSPGLHRAAGRSGATRSVGRVRPGALADVRASVRTGNGDRGGLRGLRIPPTDRAAVLQRPTAPEGAAEDVPDQRRGGPASDLAAHAQQGERQPSAVGDRRGRGQGSALRAAEDHGVRAGLLPLPDQRPIRPGLLRAAYG